MMKLANLNQDIMKHLKAPVKITLILMIIFISCKNKPNNHSIKKSKNNNENVYILNQPEKCILTKKTLILYFKDLKMKYENAPNTLELELTNKAKKYSDGIVEIMRSIFESEYEINIKYEIDKSECSSKVYYMIKGEITEGEESYNVESSVVFRLDLVEGEIKITSIILAG